MRYTFSKLIGIFLFLGFAQEAIAHAANQITYHLEQHSEAGTLTVHFTPQSAMDLIETIRPQLKEKAIIQLEDYIPEFTVYFNQTIDLKMDGHNIVFYFLEADFSGHDAYLKFKAINLPFSFEEIDVEVSSFSDVYKKLSNTVQLTTTMGTANWIFNQKNTNGTWHKSELVETAQKPPLRFLFFIGGPILLALAFRMYAPF